MCRTVSAAWAGILYGQDRSLLGFALRADACVLTVAIRSGVVGVASSLPHRFTSGSERRAPVPLSRRNGLPMACGVDVPHVGWVVVTAPRGGVVLAKLWWCVESGWCVHGYGFRVRC
jgi:hypothetical protein